jgi:hypothetical protein
MGKWFIARDSKESRSCETCREYKMRGQFYDWYGHPALSSTYKIEKLVMCGNCAKREVGLKGFRKLNIEGAI